MSTKFFGTSNECPHKTVSRFYDSPIAPVGLWRCDWCGYEFRPVEVGASKRVEINESVGGITTFHGDNAKPSGPFTLPVPPDEPLVPVVQTIKPPQPAKKKEKSYGS